MASPFKKTNSTTFTIGLVLTSALILIGYHLVIQYIQFHEVFGYFSVPYHEFPLFVVSLFLLGVIVGVLFALFLLWLNKL